MCLWSHWLPQQQKAYYDSPKWGIFTKCPWTLFERNATSTKTNKQANKKPKIPQKPNNSNKTKQPETKTTPMTRKSKQLTGAFIKETRGTNATVHLCLCYLLVGIMAFKAI